MASLDPAITDGTSARNEDGEDTNSTGTVAATAFERMFWPVDTDEDENPVGIPYKQKTNPGTIKLLDFPTEPHIINPSPPIPASLDFETPNSTGPSFRYFSKLATEIRLKIWKLSLPEARVIHLKYDVFQKSTQRRKDGWRRSTRRRDVMAKNQQFWGTWVFDNKFPPMAHHSICQESRFICLKYYKLFGFGEHQRCFIDFEMDILFINTNAVDWYSDDTGYSVEDGVDRLFRHEQEVMLGEYEHEDDFGHYGDGDGGFDFSDQVSAYGDDDLPEVPPEAFVEYHDPNIQLPQNDEHSFEAVDDEDCKVLPPKIIQKSKQLRKNLKVLAINECLYIHWPFLADYGSQVTCSNCGNFRTDEYHDDFIKVIKDLADSWHRVEDKRLKIQIVTTNEDYLDTDHLRGLHLAAPATLYPNLVDHVEQEIGYIPCANCEDNEYLDVPDDNWLDCDIHPPRAVVEVVQLVDLELMVAIEKERRAVFEELPFAGEV